VTGPAPSNCVRTTSATFDGSTVASRRIAGQTSLPQDDMSRTTTVRREPQRRAYLELDGAD
jgi:hypothetical protein